MRVHFVDVYIGVLEPYDRGRLDTITNATMTMTTAPSEAVISGMSKSGVSVSVFVVDVVVPVSSVVVEVVEEVEAFHPASMAISHQNARPFCSQLV